MSDEISISNLPSTDRNIRLLKEAYSLVQELASMDKQIDLEVRRINGDFAVKLEKFFDEQPIANFVKDQARDKGIEKAIEFCIRGLVRALKLGVMEVPFIGVAVAIATSDKQPSYRNAYLDDHPSEAVKYETMKKRLETKKQRLHQIFIDLSDRPSVPIMVNIIDTSKHEAAWRMR